MNVSEQKAQMDSLGQSLIRLVVRSTADMSWWILVSQCVSECFHSNRPLSPLNYCTNTNPIWSLYSILSNAHSEAGTDLRLEPKCPLYSTLPLPRRPSVEDASVKSICSNYSKNQIYIQNLYVSARSCHEHLYLFTPYTSILFVRIPVSFY